MQQVSPNVYVENGFTGCNASFVVTSEGVVLVDTPQLPADAVKWRRTVERYGPIKYVINSEPHADHFSGNCFFEGIGIAHEGTRESILKTPLEFLKGLVRKSGPENVQYVDQFYLRPPSITFSEKLNLYLGKHTFHLIHMPGHSPYQIAVYIPEEKVVMTSDNIICRLQPGLHQALPYHWLESLDRLAALGDNKLIPGHGSICDVGYIPEMKAIISDWTNAVKTAIENGMSLEEAKKTISFADRYPMEEGHPLTMEQVQHENITRLYEVLKQ